MKTKSILVGLLASALPLPAATEAPTSDVRVQSESTTVQDQTLVFIGKPVVILGDMRVHAETITYHRDTGRMECTGEAKVEMPRGVIAGRDAVIDTKEHKLTISGAIFTVPPAADGLDSGGAQPRR
jgi:lipopolysaccharide export system protein LptA